MASPPVSEPLAAGQGGAPGFWEAVHRPELVHAAPCAASVLGDPVVLWGAHHAAVSQPWTPYGEGLPVPAISLWAAQHVGAYRPVLLDAGAVPVAPWGAEHVDAYRQLLVDAGGAPVAPWGPEHVGAYRPLLVDAAGVPVAPWGPEHVGAYGPLLVDAAGVPVAPWGAHHVGAYGPLLVDAAGVPVAPWGAHHVGAYGPLLVDAAGVPVPGVPWDAGRHDTLVPGVPWGTGFVSAYNPGLLHTTAVPVAPWDARLVATNNPWLLHAAGPVAPWDAGFINAYNPRFLHTIVPVAPWDSRLVGAYNPWVLYDTVAPVVAWDARLVGANHPWLPVAAWGAGLVGPQSLFHGAVSVSPVAPGAVERVRVHHPEVLDGVAVHGTRGRVGAPMVDGRVHGGAIGRGVPLAPRRQGHPIGNGRGAPQARPALPAGSGGQIPAGQGRRARRRAAQSLLRYKGQAEEDSETYLVRPPEGEGLNQNSEPVVEENGDLSEIYDDMVHHVKSIRQLSNKRRLVQEEANDAVDWSSISRQVSNIDSTIRMLLDDYDRMTQEANNTRSRIRSLGGHPVEPPMLLSEHPRSLLK